MLRGRPEVLDRTEVVIDATRHILATTLTTIGGFTPLIIFGGRFWPPMATAIAGGVGGAAIVALYLVPSVFTAMRRRDLARQRRLDQAGPKRPLRVVGATVRRLSNAVLYLGSPGR